jgi:hypothetical protein
MDTDDWAARAAWYLEFWEVVLGSLLGWTAEQVRDWGKDKVQALSGPSIYHHEPPEYYIAYLFIPEQMRHRLACGSMLRLEERISSIITDAYRATRNLSDFDWDGIRRAIAEVIAAYEVELGR